jgi:hypothetical protein
MNAPGSKEHLRCLSPAVARQPAGPIASTHIGDSRQIPVVAEVPGATNAVVFKHAVHPLGSYAVRRPSLAGRPSAGAGVPRHYSNMPAVAAGAGPAGDTWRDHGGLPSLSSTKGRPCSRLQQCRLSDPRQESCLNDGDRPPWGRNQSGTTAKGWPERQQADSSPSLAANPGHPAHHDALVTDCAQEPSRRTVRRAWPC